jgi:hypothetical protein
MVRVTLDVPIRVAPLMNDKFHGKSVLPVYVGKLESRLRELVDDGGQVLNSNVFFRVHIGYDQLPTGRHREPPCSDINLGCKSEEYNSKLVLISEMALTIVLAAAVVWQATEWNV